MNQCSVETCSRESRVRGLCGLHYGRWHRLGDPLMKRRARGLMDAPVLTYRQERALTEPRRPKLPIPPRSSKVLLVLTEARGIVSRQELSRRTGATEGAVQNAVGRIRARFGYDVIRTHALRGYQLVDAHAVLESLRRAS